MDGGMDGGSGGGCRWEELGELRKIIIKLRENKAQQKMEREL